MDNGRRDIILSNFKFRETFTTPYSQYADREGQPFAVIRQLSDKKRDPEVGVLYLIRFEDGTEIHAWPEEVLEEKE